MRVSSIPSTCDEAHIESQQRPPELESQAPAEGPLARVSTFCCVPIPISKSANCHTTANEACCCMLAAIPLPGPPKCKSFRFPSGQAHC